MKIVCKMLVISDMNKKTKNIIFFINNPPLNPTIRRFVKYAQYQTKKVNLNLTKKEKYLLQKFDLFTCREDFKNEIKNLRKKYKIPNEGFRKFDDAFDWLQLLNNRSLKSFEDSLKKIHKHFHIDRRWLELIEYWLVTGKVDIHNIIPKPVKIEYFENEFTGKPEMFLRIYSDTQQKDLVNYWDIIEKYQCIEPIKTTKGTLRGELSNTNSRNQINVIRDEKEKNRARLEEVIKPQKRAFELRQEGKSYVYIANILNAEKLTKDCTYSDVGNLIRRFKMAIHKSQLN